MKIRIFNELSLSCCPHEKFCAFLFFKAKYICRAALMAHCRREDGKGRTPRLVHKLAQLHIEDVSTAITRLVGDHVPHRRGLLGRLAITSTAAEDPK